MWENNHKFMVPDEMVIGHNHTLISYTVFLQSNTAPYTFCLWIMTYIDREGPTTKPSIEHSAY